MSTRTVAVIQARMASSRLPGKVLMDLDGRPMLSRVVERVRAANRLDETLVATTVDASDDPVVGYCRDHGILVTRGDHYDVLDRYHEAARTVSADVVVRITADCPLIDPQLIDDAVDLLRGSQTAHERGQQAEYDLVANRLPPPWHRTYPIGLDTEVCLFHALERAWREAREPEEREHVLPFVYKGVALHEQSRGLRTGTSDHGFRVAVMDYPEDLGSQRWTVDTPEDLEFVRQIYRRLKNKTDFTWLDVLDLLRGNPELAEINAGVHHKWMGDVDTRAPDAGGA